MASAIRVLVSSGLLLTGCCAFAGSPVLTDQSSATVPAVSWLQAYVQFSTQYGYSLHGNTTLPVAWLYDPAGEPVKFFTQSETSQLNAVMRGFPTMLAGTKALAHEPSLEATRKILQKAGAENAKVQPSASQWTAVLVLPKSFAKECEACANFLRPIEAAAKRSHGKLYLVMVWVTGDSGG